MPTSTDRRPATKSKADQGGATTRTQAAFTLAAAAFLAALTGCVDPGARSTYYGPVPAGEEVVYGNPDSSREGLTISVESDFYGPLEPYGEWMEIDGYGRCWRPRGVVSGWRPYSDGHWQRTESGWYWESNESWGWATYHYGRWNEDARYGWYWVPETHWAPAWVSWREGGGYAGWAPLPPRRRNGIAVEVELSPRAFVYVEERHFSERVRPSTVIANNNTIVNQTVNITNNHVTNNTVINEGPRTDIIEKATGRRVGVAPVQDVRRNEETKVAIKPRPAPVERQRTAQPPPAEDHHRGTAAEAADRAHRETTVAPPPVPPKPDSRADKSKKPLEKKAPPGNKDKPEDQKDQPRPER